MSNLTWNNWQGRSFQYNLQWDFCRLYSSCIMCWDWNFSPRVTLHWTALTNKHGCFNETPESTLSNASLWLGRKTQIFSGANQKPDRLWPFGTGVIRQYPQGLLVLTWRERDPSGSLRTRKSREIHFYLVQWQFVLQLGGVGGF